MINNILLDRSKPAATISILPIISLRPPDPPFTPLTKGGINPLRPLNPFPKSALAGGVHVTFFTHTHPNITRTP
jgi:hypothetical protein